MTQKVTHKQLKFLLKQYYRTKLPMFVWGTFGIGKSQTIRDTAIEISEEKKRKFVEWNKTTEEEKKDILENPEKYFVFIDIRLSEFDSSDIKGLPVFADDKKTIEWKIPTWAKLTSLENSDGILFFDEINLAPTLVQGSCYKIIYDRIINEEKLNKEWFVLGAGNLDSDNAFTHTLPSPLKDRGGEVELSPPHTKDWIMDYAIPNKFDSRIVGYLSWKESSLRKVDSNDGQKFTTERGWDRLNSLTKDTPLSDMDMIVKSAIGEGMEQNTSLSVEFKINWT